ncbi:MAG TPA: hypothetical protein PKC83_09305 [Gemmatimonadaceae bacterium]|nr:hypothetical protein [Gemmatimonadaceae bacterium]
MTAPSLPNAGGGPPAPVDGGAAPLTPPPSRETGVRPRDRAVDAVAALLLAGGVALFFLGRQALTSIADGTYAAPMGETWVQRADFHAAQTRWGGWLIAAGVAVALVSAGRHAWHRRARR